MLGATVYFQCKKMSDTGFNAGTGSMGYRIFGVLGKCSYVFVRFVFCVKLQAIHKIDQFACLEHSSEIKYIPFLLRGNFTGT